MADSSLHLDRKALARFAWAGIPLVWIVNLKKQEVEVYSDPSGPTENPEYARREIFQAGSNLSLVLDGQEVGPVPVEELMG
jgi:Uma2 family endonuclease